MQRRTSSNEAHRYARLKLELAQKFASDRQAYTATPIQSFAINILFFCVYIVSLRNYTFNLRELNHKGFYLAYSVIKYKQQYLKRQNHTNIKKLNLELCTLSTLHG